MSDDFDFDFDEDDAELMELAHAAAASGQFDISQFDPTAPFDPKVFDAMHDAVRGMADDGEDLSEATPEQIAAIQAEIMRKKFEPKPYEIKRTKKIIGVVDSETDPFEHGLVVKPFSIGVALPDRYVDFWGDDCVIQFFQWLALEEDEYILYAHNGGKFDFHFFLQFLDSDQTPLIMGSRLVKIYFQGQEFRDSFAIIPQALSTYKKDDIDYAKFTRERREKYKAEILAYQKTDCIYTLELIMGFHELFGDKLTVASAALPMLHSFHGFDRMKPQQDERFRPYYYGGRVQCFEKGVLLPHLGKQWKMVDRNSMYPSEMKDSKHPISANAELQTTITKATDFACIEAYSEGALPMRAEDGSLSFPTGMGIFHATIHEINAGLETGTLRINRVKHAWAFARKASFEEFVLKFYGLRLDAKEIGDKIRDILYKLILNSAYGKFALNPAKFKQFMMTLGEIPEPLASRDNPKGWSLEAQTGDVFIWSRPNPRRGGHYNVATAASITGAARANLWRNIQLATRPVYCDTDSIICEDFRGYLNKTELGAWDLEKTGDMVAIAGKKLYALYNENEVVKKAAKGVGISAQDIVDICRGQEVLFENPAPTFKLSGAVEFVSRRVKMTG